MVVVVKGSCGGVVWKLWVASEVVYLGASAANGYAQAKFTRRQV
jgi:hypothetical protein